MLDKEDKTALSIFSAQNKKLFDDFLNLLMEFCKENNYKFSDTTSEKPELKNSLPNAREGQYYEYEFKGEFRINNVEFVENNKADNGYGLQFDKEGQKISGIVDIGNNLGIDINITTINELSRTESYSLHINPNSQKLWKNIPSNSNIPFWKSDSDSKIIKETSATMIAARQRGRSHAHKGICCDDDFNIIYNQKRNCFIAAVSDGAGSCEYSRLGSKLLVDAVCESINEKLNQDDWNELPEQSNINERLKNAIDSIFLTVSIKAYETLYNVVRNNDERYKDVNNIHKLSSTLLCAFSLPLNNGQWLVCSYWIGDGALAIFDENNQINLLGEQDSGKYSGETRFFSAAEIITDKQYDIKKISSRVRINISNNPLVILMTDGVSDPKFPNDNALKESELWQTLINDELKEILIKENPEKELEEYLKFWSEGEHDDRTLALIIPNKILEDLKNSSSINSNDEFALSNTAENIDLSNLDFNPDLESNNSEHTKTSPEDLAEFVKESIIINLPNKKD